LNFQSFGFVFAFVYFADQFGFRSVISFHTGFITISSQIESGEIGSIYRFLSETKFQILSHPAFFR
jgi:hypothetical protein